ncbi:MAG: GNAT family N-acetyltransferase [Planctomycetaceae bacterium]
MIEYRPFHNTDPPKLTELWNFGRLGAGAVQDLSNDMFDALVLSEPYFDRQGLIVAAEGAEAVGFVHAGFAANAHGSGLGREAGVICALMVRIDRRRQGIGRELVRRADAYLRERGARTIHAGESAGRDPFYLGLYGSAEAAGFLDSDPAAAPFFTAVGYVPAERWLVFRRDLSRGKDLFDVRAIQVKRAMKFGVFDKPPGATWWWMTRYGRFDSLTFVLLPNDGGTPPARMTCWNMELHALTRGQRTVGISSIFTEEAARRKGYAKVLMCEVLRRLREDGVTHVEAVAADKNAAAEALLKSAGFEQADAGVVYRCGADPVEP